MIAEHVLKTHAEYILDFLKTLQCLVVKITQT